MAAFSGNTSVEEDLRHLYSGLSSPFKFPFYHRHAISILPFVSDKYLSLLAPIVMYWAASMWFFFLDTAELPFFEKYRLHESQEVTKRNRVSAKKVVIMVLLQQAIQTGLGILVLEGDEVSFAEVFQDHQANVSAIGVKVANAVIAIAGTSNGVRILGMLGPHFANWLYWWGIPALQLGWAFLLMDAWQYCWHRAFHESRFLYKHFHSHHHRLYVPYAFGALYNHPLEGLILDSAGTALAHACAFMTIRQAILLFTFSTLKTVCDHGGYAFPIWLDPLHLIFPNTAEYHDVHHQMQGLRYNFSQPYFIHFDILFGTRMSAEKFKKMREVNKKYKTGALQDDAQTLSKAQLSTSESEEDAGGALRRRAGFKEGEEDLSPQLIADKAEPTRDLTVTQNPVAYRAKAGTVV